MNSRQSQSQNVRVPPGYSLEHWLQPGPNADVVVVQHLETGEQRVLKRVPPVDRSHKFPTDAKQRFCREMEILQQCDHPRLVKFLDAGVDAAGFWVVMEYLKGGSLEQYLKSRPDPMAVPEALRLISGVLEGLIYLHAARLTVNGLKNAATTEQQATGVVHRDLKPANLLFVDDHLSDLKISDFGLAKAYELAGMSGITSSRTQGGTFQYMSRSQAADFLFAEPGVDVWAAIAVLYRMLTGQTPRDHTGLADDAVVTHRPPRAILSLNPALPQPLAAVIDDVLRHDEDAGILDAAQVHAQLQNSLP